MIEILGAIILSILAVMLAAFGIGAVSEKYKKLEEQVKKEVPNYAKILPEYRLVEEIPEKDKREKEVKYFNDKDLMERVRAVDLTRVLSGERTTITDTPVVKLDEKEERQNLKKEAEKRAEAYELFAGMPPEKAFEKAKREVVNEHVQRVYRGGTYKFESDVVETFDKSELADVDVYPHEDWHAVRSGKSKYYKEQREKIPEINHIKKETEELITEAQVLKKDMNAAKGIELSQNPNDTELENFFSKENATAYHKNVNLEKRMSDLSKKSEALLKKKHCRSASGHNSS